MKKTKLKPISKTRSKALRDYAKVRREYLEDHTMCGVCHCRFASEIHHMKGRIGLLLCCKQFFISCCPRCHKLITDHPKWAMDAGYSLDRLAR